MLFRVSSKLFHLAVSVCPAGTDVFQYHRCFRVITSSIHTSNALHIRSTFFTSAASYHVDTWTR